jgi:hypothetical protein
VGLSGGQGWTGSTAAGITSHGMSIQTTGTAASFIVNYTYTASADL